jgi:hypothetical protein
MRERLVNTPYLSAWLATLRTALKPRGHKARLIEFLAGIDGTTIAVKRVELAAILREDRIPNGETVLRVQAWLKAPTAKKATGRRKPAKRTA